MPSKSLKAHAARACCAALALLAVPLRAQMPAPSVGVGYGVDTARADVGAIVRLVRDYLSRPDTTAHARGLWSTTDPVDRRNGDLTGELAYQGAPATVLGVVSQGPGDSVYAVKVLHARADRAGARVPAIALQRLYAVRAPGAPHGWLLANALPRHTRGWERHVAGRVTFHYEPGQRGDVARRARAARFADSVAATFGVAPPERIDYYVAASPDAYFRALGLDFWVSASGPGTWRGASGGRLAASGDGVVFGGDPTQGDANLHELVHAVLSRRIGGGAFVEEGAAAWLGGALRHPPRELLAWLARYQRDHPAATLRALVAGETPSGDATRDSEARYASGALFIDAVHRRGGVAGLRRLTVPPDAGSGVRGDATLAFLRAHLGLPAADPDALERWWRDAARQAAAR